MDLKLKKPIAFFDLETTGIDVSNDRIVEISILKIFPDQHRESKTYVVNPTIPIPEETSEIHGFYDHDVKDAPTFKEIGKDVAEFIGDADLAGYNSNRFDVPVLMEEFLRIGIDLDMSDRNLVDVQTVFHRMEQRTLSAAYKFYCDKSLINAHSAEADTLATYEILKSQLDRYQGEIQNDMDSLHEFSKHGNKHLDFVGRFALNKQEVPVFNFGKHKGRPVMDVLDMEPGYYNWIMKGNFPLYTKKVLKEIKDSFS